MARGRPKGSKNGSGKAAGGRKKKGAGAPAAGAPPVGEAGLDEVYRRHLADLRKMKKEIKAKQAEVREASGVYRARLKVAKADGCNVKSITQALADLELDATEVNATYVEIGRVHRLLGSPIGFQGDLFKDSADSAAVKGEGPVTPEVAFQRGRAACANGEPNACKEFVAGTELHVKWMEGWNAQATEEFGGGKKAGGGIGRRSAGEAPAGNA